MSRIAVLFDIDGTLLSTSGAGGRAMHKALKKQFEKSIPVTAVSLAGRCDRGIFTDLLTAAEVAATEDNFQKLAGVYYQCLEEELGSQDSKLLPGVQEILDLCSDHDSISVGLLTGNFKRGADMKLNHFGISRYFGFGGFGDHFSCRNELAKSMLETVEKSAGVTNPEKIWIIGDTPADIACAKAIGAKCVAVATGEYQHDVLSALGAEYVLKDLTEASVWHEKLF